MKSKQPKKVYGDIASAYMKGGKPPAKSSKPRGCGAAKRGCTPCKEC